MRADLVNAVQAAYTHQRLGDYFISQKLNQRILNGGGFSLFKLDNQGTTTTYGSTSGVATSTPATAGTAGITWQKEIIRYAEASRMFDQAVMQNVYMVNTGAHEVMIPRTSSHLDIDVTSTGEGESRHFTDQSNVVTTPVTIAKTDYLKGGIAISKETNQNTMADRLSLAREQLGEDMAQRADVATATELQDTSVTNVVYGGSGNSSVDGLATGDVMTPDLTVDAMEKIESNNFIPRMLFLGTPQIKAFRKSSQFINASEYGSDEVVLKGEIGNYLGVRIIKTTNTPAYSSGATDTNENTKTWGATGHTCIMVGTNKHNKLVGGVMAWKEMPSINYEYDLDTASHRFYSDQCFKVKVLEPKAICLIKVSDA